MTNEELLKNLETTYSKERKHLADFLYYLAEVDARKLYAQEHSSLFTFCTNRLKISEPSTCKRIQAARAAKKHPILLDLIRENKITLTTINLIAPHITEELIQETIGMKKRQVEDLLATKHPQPDVQESMRLVPMTKTRTFSRECKPVLKPLSPQRVKVQLTLDTKTRDLMEKARLLLRRKYPQGRLEEIVTEAFETLIKKLEPQARTAHRAPTKHTRYIPVPIKRQVWERDQGKCQYKTPSGKQCGEQAFLEFDHAVPWSMGDSSHDPNNIQLLCHTHNQLKAGPRGISSAQLQLETHRTRLRVHLP